MSEDEFPDQDPGDKAFGAAAAGKEETLDEARDAGAADELSDEPGAATPRAGGKAEPA